MGERYPERIPPALAEVLGMPAPSLYPIWCALRELGLEVPRRYEGEVASALHFLIPLAIAHPEDWRAAAAAELSRLQSGHPMTPTRIPGWYKCDQEERVARAIAAACSPGMNVDEIWHAHIDEARAAIAELAL